MSNDSLGSPVRRVGRPRADKRVPEGDVSEHILAASAELFIRQGYTATTTRQIAAAVGLRQGSLSHYFPRKKDIFAELLDRTVEPALTMIDGLDPGLPPEVRLWLLLSTDCFNLASGEQNLASLMLLPEARSDEFDQFWARRDQLKDRYRDIIVAGLRHGSLSCSDVLLAVDATFGIVESIITWFERGGPVTSRGAVHHVARAALAALLTSPSEVDRVIAQAEALVAA
ncbi:MAG: TetR/AcrR family transcriptional regulator [Acidimicrobiaceae bacterium]|nr:TetR/AcrR family transcriptional regulator [Acidimicrobiaceae bacterium]MYG98746.1 TetR/AcrR family transcriptional regulator [Acidimicrobiaceae bacterium]MYL04104.1 TetR/AcrR family transcriptional regulator [Acidimicrobiaceae bacterium]